MIGRFFSIILFIMLGYFIWKMIKFIFKIGRATGEFNRRFEEMKKPGGGPGKKGSVIELDKDQYKVE